MAGLVCLMYHELSQPGRAPCDTDPGYLRYVVGEDRFRAHLAALAANGFRGGSLGDSLGSGSADTQVVITFDDGCETDLLLAAPLLREYGFGATFYIVTGSLGRRGFLSPAQLRQLAEAGFEIGSHSVSHAYLPDLPPDQARRELAESKARLEQYLGRAVEHFSCPGGRWSPAVAVLAREAGYRSVATSRVGINAADADPLRLARVAVQATADAEEVVALARGRGLNLRRARTAVLAAAKQVLGNHAYERLRGRLLRPAGAAHE